MSKVSCTSKLISQSGKTVKGSTYGQVEPYGAIVHAPPMVLRNGPYNRSNMGISGRSGEEGRKGFGGATHVFSYNMDEYAAARSRRIYESGGSDGRLQGNSSATTRVGSDGRQLGKEDRPGRLATTKRQAGDAQRTDTNRLDATLECGRIRDGSSARHSGNSQEREAEAGQRTGQSRKWKGGIDSNRDRAGCERPRN